MISDLEEALYHLCAEGSGESAFLLTRKIASVLLYG